MAVLVPPIKCQGIKTKLIDPLTTLFNQSPTNKQHGSWIEPFCGSCVVPLNIQPQRASLADTNMHIIRFYQDLQSNAITPALVREYLEAADEQLRTLGESYYYAVRDRFNNTFDSLDFLFLNRACFNGMMRFNRKGAFNVPFCRKPDRFRRSYITKIVNQIQAFQKVIQYNDWTFEVADFKTTLAKATAADIVYLDPPYLGRHVDYYNSWDETAQSELIECVKTLPCTFIFSTWHSDKQHRTDIIEQRVNDRAIQADLL